jgi:hypothetical protein
MERLTSDQIAQKVKPMHLCLGFDCFCQQKWLREKDVQEIIEKQKKTNEFFMTIEKKKKKPNKMTLASQEGVIIACQLILQDLENGYGRLKNDKPTQ